MNRDTIIINDLINKIEEDIKAIEVLAVEQVVEVLNKYKKHDKNTL